MQLQPFIERIRTAAEQRTPLRIRGGGSKDFYGTPGAGEVLDTTPLAGVLAYEPSELFVTVGAGTPLAELEAMLAGQNQCLPFEPPHFAHAEGAGRAARAEPLDERVLDRGTAAGIAATRAEPLSERALDRGAAAGSAATRVEPLGEHVSDRGTAAGIAATRVEPLGERVLDRGTAAGSAATVGGMVAAGLSGPSRASVGCVRDYVLGAALVNGRGEHLRFGGTVMKNVAGYDVSRVLAGSMGQLGLITEVSLKVLPVAPAEATLEFACTQAEALRLLNGWGGQPWPLNASAWQADGAGRQGTLWLRLRGALAAVDSACRHLGGERRAHAHAAADWAALRDQRLPFFADALARGLALWRVSVPQTAPALDLPGAPLVEWHGGLRWYALPAAQAAAVRAAARAAGGHATFFVAGSADGAGAAARNGLEGTARFDALSPALARIHGALRERFDPAGIFNPGRLLA